MQGRRLAVLMWKHLTVRMRRYLHTPIELLSPIAFFIILFSFKEYIKPVPPPAVRIGQNEIKNTDVLQLKDLPNTSRILYTPDTELTRDLMDAVGAQLGLKRLRRPPDTMMRNVIVTHQISKREDLDTEVNMALDRAQNRKGYYAFTNITEISYIVANMHDAEAIVIFNNMKDRNTWPDEPRLIYTIRMKSSFFTNSYEPFDGTRKPHRQFGTAYHQFMRLQWAIDTSYIKTLTGSEVTQALSLQEFPSFGRSSSDVMPLICDLLEVLCWMSLFLVFVFLMARLLEERATGIQELIKMVGVSTNLFGVSHFLNVLPTGLVYSVGGTLLLTTSSNPIIENSSPVIIFIILALHYVSVVAMAFACSYIVQSTQYTVSLSVFLYVALWMPARLVMKYEARGVGRLSGLLPHVPVQWCWAQVALREQYGEGLTFSEALTSRSPKSGPVLLGALFLMLQALFFFALSWYLSLVRPGKYGQALPWNFLFQKQYWTKNEVVPDSEIDEEVPIAREAKYFEEPPKDLDVGIKIENVSKLFPKHKALSNVSFDVYKGEITVLLGHNGAGKTTLMSIITGMSSATEGRVLVNGLDVRAAGAAVRTQLGLCPQHNLFFPDLTVLEHVMFFTLLKGGSYRDARAKSLELLDRLGLKDKAGVHSGALSGGMKRRLQLACALAGGASVLVLDEPTSGLDVETRRDLWDLLLSLRGERTVLLTTHFMEEADALGDRVAALHLGRLRCLATTMHLKKAVGTGYRLTFTTNGPPRDAAVTAAVTSHVPDATLKEKTINSLSYSLPASASGHFPALFTSLEERKSELGVETIGVGVSTLEEVFLKLCSDTATPLNEDEVDTARIEPTYNKITGPKLYARQFFVLLKRQVKYVWYKKTSFFFLQALIPIIMICVITTMTNNESARSSDSERLSLDLDMYKAMPERRVLYHVASDGVSVNTLTDRWPKVDFIATDDVAKEILNTSEKDANEYNKFLAGFEINNTHVKALFTTTVRHAAPVALGLLSNALATRHVPRADGAALRAHAQPVRADGGLELHDDLNRPKDMENVLTWSLLIVFVILATNINFVSLPCKERAAGTRHIHLMAGCPAALHWAAAAAWHAALCGALLVCVAALAAAALDTDRTLRRADFIGSVMLVLMLGALAFLSFLYLVSCYFDERVASVILVAALVIFGLVTPVIKTATELLKKEEPTYYDVLLSLAAYVMPPHASTVAVAKCAYAARLNAFCDLNRERCPMLFVAEVGFDAEKCCAGEKPVCFMCISDYAPGKEMIVLTVQFFVYMTLVILTQRGLFNSVHDRIFNGRYRNTARTEDSGDEIVRAEAVYVNKQMSLPKKKILESDHAMLVNDLHKNYFRLIGKSCNAVRGVSFSVKKGECFGLLGVNGAGKSTTFKMLTAEECATKGDIYANGHFRSETQAYLRTLGYCPQFFGLDEFLTGAENLTLLLTLRGLDAADVSREVDSWIEVVGLQKYAARAVAGYSGGCARRLAAAAALASGAPLALLDEPTSGVDVSARRRVWAALARGLRRGRAVIITSHSMDEMEALCSRIAIMAGGRVRAVGAPGELRARHAAGHAVVIKVAPPRHGDEVDSVKSDLERLKSSLQHKFNCTLKDEHKTMLHYHINETMRYSNLFSALEELKATYPSLVEDYSVTETTLEEVFLSFAKEQRQQPEPETRNHVV